MTTARISLNNPVFSGRLRNFERRSTYERREVRVGRQGLVSDVRPAKTAAKAAPKPQYQAKSATVTRSQAVPALPLRTERSMVLKRATVGAPKLAQAPTPAEKPQRQHVQKRLLTALAVLLFMFGIGVAIDGFMANRHVEAQVEQVTGGGSNAEAAMVGDIPGEEDRPNVGAYQVAATLPRKISIPKLGAEARILKLGVTASGAMAAPANIFDTGWYDQSAKPGEAGAMLIDGHVHGPSKPGVFHQLKTLKSGDEITVERGDGQTFTYKVVKTKSYPADSIEMMGAALTPITAGKPGLNLITCTGELDKATNHYKDRLVVFAEQL